MMTRGQGGFEDEQGFSAESRMIAERANTPIGSATHLAVNDTSWTAENMGEKIYVYTLWILNRMVMIPKEERSIEEDGLGRNWRCL